MKLNARKYGLTTNISFLFSLFLFEHICVKLCVLCFKIYGFIDTCDNVKFALSAAKFHKMTKNKTKFQMPDHKLLKYEKVLWHWLPAYKFCLTSYLAQKNDSNWEYCYK